MELLLWRAYHIPGMMSDITSILALNPLKNVIFNIYRRENEVPVSNVT